MYKNNNPKLSILRDWRKCHISEENYKPFWCIEAFKFSVAAYKYWIFHSLFSSCIIMNWMPKNAFTFENMRHIHVGGRMTVSRVKSSENILAFALVFFSSTITTRKTRSDVIHKCDVLGEKKLGDGTYCIQILRVFYARFSLWYFQARGSIYFARIFFFFTAEKKMFSHSPYCIFWRTDFAYKWNGMGYVNEEKITLSQFQRWTSFRDTFWKR